MVTVVSGGLFFFHGTGGSEEPLTQITTIYKCILHLLIS